MHRLIINIPLIIFFTIGVLFSSCTDDNKDEPNSDIQELLLGDWYAVSDGWKMSFFRDKCTQTLWNGRQSTFNYSLVGNQLTVESFSGISGTITYIDGSILKIYRSNSDSYFEFSRTPHPNWNNGNSNNDNSGNNNSDNNGNTCWLN